jgi:WD40 repeat protein
LLRQTEAVTTLSFTPDGERLATIGKGNALRLWDLRPPADLLVLTRLLSAQQFHAPSASFVPFVIGDLRQSGAQLRARFPREFGQE